ncbi:MAG: hypothetical protein C0597_17385 [Marinilabiliales bacterium]|nr:MAG: hypothetical protein C0597_17385 [Marinilabiliales bacterium]
MKIRYKIIKDKKLLILKFEGAWSIDDYKISLKKVIQNADYESVHKVLSDFRNVSVEEALSQLKELAEIREKTIQKKYQHVRVVNGPLSTVIALLYREELTKRGYLDEYCSTLEHAIKLLGLKENVSEIEELLNNLDT